MAKKHFGLRRETAEAISDTLTIVENNESYFQSSVIPVDKIVTDPENPRKLVLERNEVQHKLSRSAIDYEKKMKELSEIRELADSIKSNGLLHPITVYKKDDHYQIVAGERRFLAHLVLGRKTIETRVFNESPKNFTKKLVQWFENNSRKDLSLFERLSNIASLCEEYQREKGVKVTAEQLATVTGMSKTISSYYLAVLRAEPRLMRAVEESIITSLETAYTISKLKNVEQMEEAIKQSMEGSTTKQTVSFVKSLIGSQVKSEAKSSKKGRTASRVNLGNTQNTFAIKEILHCIASDEKYQFLKAELKDVDWSDYNEVAKAFKQMLRGVEALFSEAK